MWTYVSVSEMYHHGIKGQKWGVRRFQNKDGSLTPAGKQRYDDDDIVIKKGEEIHRIIPKDWLEKEKTLSGHAYATFKKEDTERYKHFAKLFGNGDNYVDMTFNAKDVIVSIIDDTKTREALAIVNDENQRLAIGKGGINIKLASKLTKFRINIKTMDQINEEGNR